MNSLLVYHLSIPKINRFSSITSPIMKWSTLRIFIQASGDYSRECSRKIPTSVYALWKKLSNLNGLPMSTGA
jgi:hypothetical protein